MLSACGGGGDGGSGGGGRNESAETGVRLLHGSIDVPPILAETSAAPGVPIDQIRFNQSSYYAELPEGPQTLAVRSNDGGNLFSLPVTVADGERRSALLYGTREALGIRVSLLDDVPPELENGFAAIRVVHALAGAATISGSLGGTALPASVGFGKASSYVTVPAGPVSISLARSVDGRTVASQPQQVASRKSYSFMVTGEVGYLTFTNLLED